MAIGAFTETNLDKQGFEGLDAGGLNLVTHCRCGSRLGG